MDLITSLFNTLLKLKHIVKFETSDYEKRELKTKSLFLLKRMLHVLLNHLYIKVI